MTPADECFMSQDLFLVYAEAKTSPRALQSVQLGSVGQDLSVLTEGLLRANVTEAHHI